MTDLLNRMNTALSLSPYYLLQLLVWQCGTHSSDSVGRFRASRDIPLPYDLPSTVSSSVVDAHTTEPSRTQSDFQAQQPKLSYSGRLSSEPIMCGTGINTLSTTAYGSPRAISFGADLERAVTGESSRSTRLRSSKPGTLSSLHTSKESPIQRRLSRVGAMMAEAHTQDFERRQKSSSAGSDGEGSGADGDENDERDEWDNIVSGEMKHLGSTEDDDDDDDDDDDGEVNDNLASREDAETLSTTDGQSTNCSPSAHDVGSSTKQDRGHGMVQQDSNEESELPSSHG